MFPPSPGNWHLEAGGGVGGVPLLAGSRSPGAPQTHPGAHLAGQPRHSASPQGCVRCQRVTPGGRRERRAGDRQGAFQGSATYLGPRETPAGPRPGRAGGRGRGARAAGALPWSPAFGAAALGARPRARTIPRGRQAGGRTSRPEGFPAAGSPLRHPRAAPAQPTSESRLSFFEKSSPPRPPRVRARAVLAPAGLDRCSQGASCPSWPGDEEAR